MGAAVTAMRLVLPTCVQPATRAVCLVLAMHQGACRCFSGRRSGGGSVAVHEPVVSGGWWLRDLRARFVHEMYSFNQVFGFNVASQARYGCCSHCDQTGLTDLRTTCVSRCLHAIGDASRNSQMLFWAWRGDRSVAVHEPVVLGGWRLCC